MKLLVLSNGCGVCSRVVVQGLSVVSKNCQWWCRNCQGPVVVQGLSMVMWLSVVIQGLPVVAQGLSMVV